MIPVTASGGMPSKSSRYFERDALSGVRICAQTNNWFVNLPSQCAGWCRIRLVRLVLEMSSDQKCAELKRSNCDSYDYF